MMNDSRGDEQGVGLCARCEHAQVIRNDRGSRFFLCLLSSTDPRFPKYPRLPVLSCVGFTPATDGAADTDKT
jgi:hypothetical protein